MEGEISRGEKRDWSIDVFTAHVRREVSEMSLTEMQSWESYGSAFAIGLENF